MGHLQFTPEQVRYLRSIGVGTPHGARPVGRRLRAPRFARAGNAFRRLLHSSRQLLKNFGFAAALMAFAVAGRTAAQEAPVGPALPPSATTVAPVSLPAPNPSCSAESPSAEETMQTSSSTPASSTARGKRNTSRKSDSPMPTASPATEHSDGTSGQPDALLLQAASRGQTIKSTSATSSVSKVSRIGSSSVNAAPPVEPLAPVRTRSLLDNLLISLVGSLFFTLAYSIYMMATLHRSIGRFRRREAARIRRNAAPSPAVPTWLDVPDFRACASIPDALDVFLAAASRARFPVASPEASPSAWGVGIATHCGHVRSENQDFGLAFRVAGCDVVCLADGLGGLPRGKEAARIAVAAAAWSAVQTLQTPAAKDFPHLVSGKALLDAAAAVTGSVLGGRDGGDLHGLRSTLVVLTATPTALGLAYAGDGGGFVVRASGEVQPILLPQKADGRPNVVAASLGPILQGEPQVFLFERLEGDVVLLGTDGVFDRTPSSFPKAVVRALVERSGDAKAVATSVVTDLAAAKDASGYICDDNLSVAIVGPGSAPVFGPGFWQPARR